MAVPSISSVDELADHLGVPSYLMRRYVRRANFYYKTFRIRKRAGKQYRTINAPSQEMKGIQRWISAFILSSVELPDVCMAFRPGASIVTNASAHVGKQFVCNVDIRDFFPSITAARVTGLFKKLGYDGTVAAAFARLCCFRGLLPQGAPSSPLIANIICQSLDVRLVGLCAARKWEYTRYCDDLTISGDGNMRGMLIPIKQIVKSEGFSLNDEKTRVVRRSGQQTVTGLVVNSRSVNIKRYTRKNIRAMFHQAYLEPERFVGRLDELYGYKGFLNMVNPNPAVMDRYQLAIDKVRSAAENKSSHY